MPQTSKDLSDKIESGGAPFWSKYLILTIFDTCAWRLIGKSVLLGPDGVSNNKKYNGYYKVESGLYFRS